MKKLIALKNWIKFVVTPNVYPKRWQDRLFRGHVSLGPLTIYGANAMHWAINLRIGKNYWCFHPRTRTYGALWRSYFYISRDATPTAAAFKLGRKWQYE